MNTSAHSMILQKYGIAPGARLGGGMEAEVYAYGPDAVLKLYAGTASLPDLVLLQDFYQSLDRERVPYALPYIHAISAEDGCIVTVEQRLWGRPMSDVLPGLTSGQLDLMMQCYLTAALELAAIHAPPDLKRYKLFDAAHLSQREDGDWHRFLTRYIAYKLETLTPYFERDVPGLVGKLARLSAVLDQPYHGDYRLIHGDFFPGNLLLDAEHRITALLDFGLLTMYGDPLFDVALSWVFFDMYNELKAGIYERYRALLLDRLGVQVRGTLYRYILIFSILSANTYSSTCSDGHYAWCVANLNHQEYWEYLA